MPDPTIMMLLGETFTAQDPYGEDQSGPDLYAGYIPGRTIEYVPQVQLGDGLAGPPNDQQLQIQRDNRVLPVDELGKQGPFLLKIGVLARHRAGRMFPLNYDWNAGLDPGMPGLVPAQDVLAGAPFGPDQLPAWYDGVPAPEIIPSARTVIYTASPDVGWQGY